MEPIAELAATKPNVNPGVYEEWKKKTLRIVMVQPGADSLDCKRKIQVQYRAMTLPKIEVSGLVEEVRFRSMAAIKAAVVSQQLLPETPVELLFGLSLVEGGQGWSPVDPALLTKDMH